MTEYDERIAKMHEEKINGINKCVALEQAVRYWVGLTRIERIETRNEIKKKNPFADEEQLLIFIAKEFEKYLK